MDSKKPAPSQSASRGVVIGLAVVCLVGAAILIAARKPSQPTATVSVSEAQPSVSATAQPAAKTRKAAVTQTQARKTTAPASKTPVAAVMPAKASAQDSPAVKVQTAEAAPKVMAQQSVAPVTITGCLEQNDDTFWLKETAGANAPKSRSWKSGFLKKGSASIEVIDAPNRLKLSNHVGERVSVTGVLEDREMQGRSLQRVSDSCK